MVSTYHYASGSRLTGVTTAGTTAIRVADDGGRETSLEVGGRRLTLNYSSDDHLSSVSVDGQTTTYGVDALGRRTRVSNAAGEARHLIAPVLGRGYDSPHLTSDGSGNVIAAYVYASEHPFMRIESGRSVYYLSDLAGSIIGLATEAGQLAEAIDYDAFGTRREPGELSSPTAGDFRFHGMWQDPSGIYYARARMYDPTTGRFTSRDRARGFQSVPDALHPYAFDRSNPFYFRDPSGRYTLTQTAAVLGGMNALANVSMQSFKVWTNRAKYANATEVAASIAIAGLAGFLEGAAGAYLGRNVPVPLRAVVAVLNDSAWGAITSVTSAIADREEITGATVVTGVASNVVVGGVLMGLGRLFKNFIPSEEAIRAVAGKCYPGATFQAVVDRLVFTARQMDDMQTMELKFEVLSEFAGELGESLVGTAAENLF